MDAQTPMHDPYQLPPPTTRVFAKFRAHNVTPRTSTELTILESIRNIYPGQQVTLTTPNLVDLHGYAEAGHAHLTLDSATSYDATRSYKAPVNRLSNLPGTLKDHIRFAAFNYVFKGCTFIIYEVEYADTQLFKGPTRLLFIVTPKLSDEAKESVSIIDELLLTVGSWSSNLHSEIYVYDSGQWNKDKSLYASVQSSDFSSVILSPTLKQTLMTDITTFFSSRSTYTRLSVPWKRGLLFHGFPGNGKTISIRAIINMLSTLDRPVPSLVVKNLDCMQGAKFSISQIFQKARSTAPCLLVFEDLDSLIADKTRSYFLNEVDGLECNDGILMIGTTNHLDSLDPAISKRPSRFDRKYHFKLPDEEERVLYCDFWREKLDGSAGDNAEFSTELCDIVAKLTDGFSFAYMKELFIISLLMIARGEGVEDEENFGEGKTVAPAENTESESHGVTSMTASSSGDSETVIVEHPAILTAKLDASPVEPITCRCVCRPQALDTTVTKPKESKAPKKKRTVPSVPIPEYLKNNILLRVLQKQCKALLEEMDNTDEDEWIGSSSKSRRGGGEGFNPFAAAMRMRGGDDECC